jgi:hypothetical protein
MVDYSGQFGGDTDCERCGCIASTEAAVGHHRVLGPLTAGHLFIASDIVGKSWMRLQEKLAPARGMDAEPSLFEIV